MEDGYISIHKRGMRTRIMKGLEIPFAIDGKATLMVKNLLAAVLGTVISDINPYVVKIALESFIPSPDLSLNKPCNLCSNGIQILKYDAQESLTGIGVRKRYCPDLFSVPL
jgi:hypothetical protein